jgi:hypothetical protein
MSKSIWLLGLLLAATSLNATTLASHSLFSEHFVGKETVEREITFVGIPKASLKLSGKGTVQLVVHDQARNVFNRHSCNVDGSTVCELWDGHSAHFGSSNIKKITFAATPSAVGGLTVTLESGSQEEIPAARAESLMSHAQHLGLQLRQGGQETSRLSRGLPLINCNSQDDSYSWDNLYDEYAIEKELGSGHSGRVYLGSNLETGQKVAIKKMNKSVCINSNSRIALENELKILHMLPQDSNVCQFYKYFDMQSDVANLLLRFSWSWSSAEAKTQRSSS